jgi:hypothetical protein
MLRPWSRRFLLFAVCASAVLGPAVLNGAPSSSAASCSPAAFTGSVHTHATRCVAQPPLSVIGPRGPRGFAGPAGKAGKLGSRGYRGFRGLQGSTGPTGTTGSTGPAGTVGPAGAAGLPATSGFSEFYALMPGDNSATVAPGTAVAFPQNGPTSGLVTRLGASTFALTNIGTYRVAFLVSVSEPGQLVLVLNGAQLPYTVYGRATGTSQIAGEALVQTSAINSVLSVDNPLGESTALTITPSAGGTDPAVASLVIEQLH